MHQTLGNACKNVRITCHLCLYVYRVRCSIYVLHRFLKCLSSKYLNGIYVKLYLLNIYSHALRTFTPFNAKAMMNNWNALFQASMIHYICTCISNYVTFFGETLVIISCIYNVHHKLQMLIFKKTLFCNSVFKKGHSHTQQT